MKITVVIPTHKRPEMIVQCLKSVLAQTRLPDEIVIVDDNALNPDFREKTRAAVINLAIDIPLRYLTPDINLSLAFVRNLAIETITEGVIAFLDDDDSWEAKKLELCERAFETTNADVVYSDYTEYDAALVNPRGIKKMPSLTEPLFEALFVSNVIGPPSTVVVRRERCLFLDGRFSNPVAAMEDWDWYLRMAHAGAVFHHIPVPLLRYRLSPIGRINSSLGPWIRGSRLLHRLRLHLARSPERKNLARRIYCGDLIHYSLRLGNYGRFAKLAAYYVCRFGVDRLLLKRFRNFIINRLKAFHS